MATKIQTLLDTGVQRASLLVDKANGGFGQNVSTTGGLTDGQSAYVSGGEIIVGADLRMPPAPSGNGKMIYDNGTNYAAFAAGTSGQVLTSGGAGSPVWATAVASSTNLTVTGLTLFTTPVVGEVGYISADNTIDRADATAQSSSAVVGVYTGVASTLTVAGQVGVLFEAGLVLVPGNRIYVSAAVPGRVTNVAPTNIGYVVKYLGQLLDTTGYNMGAGSVQTVIFNPGLGITLDF